MEGYHRIQGKNSLRLQLWSVILGMEAASLSASPRQGTHCSCFVILFYWPTPSAAFVISAPCNFRMHGILHMELALSSTVNLNSNSCHYQPRVDFYLNSGGFISTYQDISCKNCMSKIYITMLRSIIASTRLCLLSD